MLLQTTSPSIILLASLDAARAHLSCSSGQRKLRYAVENAKFIRRELSNINGVELINPKKHFGMDITKIFLKVKGLSGKRLESILEIDYNIEVESASDEGLDRVIKGTESWGEEYNINP